MNLNYIRAAVEPPYYRATIEPGTTVSLLAFQVQQNLMFTYLSVGQLTNVVQDTYPNFCGPDIKSAAYKNFSFPQVPGPERIGLFWTGLK